MPSRETRTRPTRGSQNGANAQQRKRAMAQPLNANQQTDAWDELETMKSDNGGNNKMSTNFFIGNKETIKEVDVVILDENPTIFWGHTIKCATDAGKIFYATEACQKSEQAHCVLCDSSNKAVSKAKKVIAFKILDSRGSWKKDANGDGGLDGVPVAKIFLTPLYLAKQFKTLKDDGEGRISDKVIKLKKDDKYQANFKYEKDQKTGGMFYVDAPKDIIDNLELPNILEIYKPQDDDSLIDFVNQFAVAPPTNGATPRSGGRASSSSFGQ